MNKLSKYIPQRAKINNNLYLYKMSPGGALRGTSEGQDLKKLDFVVDFGAPG